MNTKSKLFTKTSALLIVLLLSFAVTSLGHLNQVNAQPIASTVPASMMPNLEMKIAENISEIYLRMFGFNSTTITQTNINTNSNGVNRNMVYNALKNGTSVNVYVTDSLTLYNGTNEQYSIYKAEFAGSDSSHYSVYFSKYNMSISPYESTTITNQTITGSENYQALENSTNQVMGTAVAKQVDSTQTSSNATGNFYFVKHEDGFWSLNQTTILNDTVTIDENMIGQPGQYVINLLPATNGLGAKATITLPDGATMDPGMYVFADTYCPYTYNALFGECLYWSNLESVEWTVIEVFINAFVDITLVGITCDVIDGYLALSSIFTSDMLAGDGSDLNIFYMEMINYGGDPIPIYAELGYLTDRYNWGGWQYIGWNYLGLTPDGCGMHADIWPNGGFRSFELTVYHYDVTYGDSRLTLAFT